MRKDIVKTLRYFGFFRYAPLKGEIYTFLHREVKLATFEKQLEELIHKKVVKRLPVDLERYTLGEYSMKRTYLLKKVVHSRSKIGKTRLYLRLLSFFPQIKLIGISGSVAMMNADKQADIDIFIIAARRRLWTARFMVILLAKVLKIHRQYDAKHAGDKVCLNLFFDEKKLVVPTHKRSAYVAHEVLQMKPQVVKGNSYLMYLDANRWVFDIFPNAKKLTFDKLAKKRLRADKATKVGNMVESFLKKWQLASINKRRTSEIITDTQLWFFPDDFEERLKNDKIRLL